MKKNFISPLVWAIGFLFFFGISDAQAQTRGTRTSVNGAIRNVELASDRLRTDFRNFLNGSRFNGTNQETRFNNIVAGLETSIDTLRREFNRNQNWWNTRRNMNSVIAEAKRTKRIMNNQQFGRNIESQWRNLRDAVNRLAYFYEVNGI